MAKKRPVDPGSRPQRAQARDGSELAGVAASARRVEAGTPLFRQGDRAVGIFQLVAGRVRLIRTTPDGSTVTMHSVRPGELFAEASLFSERYHCDAVAESAGEVWFFAKADLTRRLRGDPDALWAFAAELARRVQSLRARIEVKQIRSAPERVLQFLRLGCDADGVMRVDGTLKRLAEEIGLTHEALYRALATLERSRRLERRPGAIRIVDADPKPAVRRSAR